MNLGWLDICIRAKSVEASREFYEKLGFKQVEGGEGWAVLSNGQARIALFASGFMDDDSFSLNFRGGNIPQVASDIEAAGLEPASQLVFVGETGGTIRLRDPDGNLVFIDSAPEEVKKEPSD